MFDSIFYIVKHPYIHNNVINSTNSPEFENMENSLPNLIGEKFPVIAYVVTLQRFLKSKHCVEMYRGVDL